MRESIGAVSLLNFVIFFILLVFAFLMGTFSYYKAYRVNNAMVSAIEKYEGFNSLSYEEMEQKLSNFGYNRVKFKCPLTRKTTEDGFTGQLLSIDGDGKVLVFGTTDKLKRKKEDYEVLLIHEMFHVLLPPEYTLLIIVKTHSQD